MMRFFCDLCYRFAVVIQPFNVEIDCPFCPGVMHLVGPEWDHS